MLAPATRRSVFSAPRLMSQVRYNSGPASAGPTAGATASHTGFKAREQGEESVYIKQHEAEQLKKYKEKIEAHKEEIKKLEAEVSGIEKK